MSRFPSQRALCRRWSHCPLRVKAESLAPPKVCEATRPTPRPQTARLTGTVIAGRLNPDHKAVLDRPKVCKGVLEDLARARGPQQDGAAGQGPPRLGRPRFLDRERALDPTLGSS